MESLRAAPAPTQVSPQWSLLVCEARTGRVTGSLPLADLAWSTPLQFGSGSTFRAVVALDGPPGPDDRSVTARVRGICAGPFRFKLVAVYGRQPVAYGYIVTHQPSPTTVTIGCTDLAGLLAHRALVKPGWWQNPSAGGADTNLGPASKAEIARQLLLQATQEDGAELPLDIQTVATAGDNVRNYRGAELSDYTTRLRQLGETADGPDIAVTPTINADQSAVRLKVDIGQPYLGQWGSEWSLALGGNLVDIAVDSDGSLLAQRSFVPGDGFDVGKPVGVAFDDTLVRAGFPLLDRVNNNHGSAKEIDTLNAYAAADVEVYQYPVESWTLRVRADHTPLLGTYRIGDDVGIRVSRHYWIPNGFYRRRIVGISGDASDYVTLTTAPVPGGV